MKTTLALFTAVAAFAASALAEAPKPLTDLHKTLSAAAKDQKLAFILMGRPTCGNCNATKAMIRDGKIPVTSADFVMADLNVDDEKTQGEFMRKYGKANFGETLPFVVVTDAHGKALASSGGMKNTAAWTSIIADAKSKAGAKTAGVGAKTDWSFKTPAAQ